MKRRDRWQDRKKERENETDDERETRKERASVFVVFFLFFIPVSDGRGRTNDSDSRAKSYSFGPSTTWPRHNRVKVASRLSPRGGFRSAHGRKGKRGKKKEKHSTLSRAKWKSRENKDKLTVPGWMGRIHSVADCASRRRKEAPERKSDWVLILDCGRDETYKEQTVATRDWITR